MSRDDEEPISPTGYGGVLVSATGRCLLYPWDVMLDQKLVPATHNRTRATRLNSHPHVIDDSEDLVESRELHPKDLGHALARRVKFIKHPMNSGAVGKVREVDTLDVTATFFLFYF